MIRSIIKKITQNSRLDEYRAILELALEHGYTVTSLLDWYEHDFYPGKKVFILRHDVDYDAEGAFRMYQIEKGLGVRSTFYYRWYTLQAQTMKEIHENGFEVSLHFETLATYCRSKKITNASQLTEKDYEEAYKKLLEEIDFFEKEFWKIKTICSHGDHRNRLIGIPNHALLQGKDLSNLGIYFETYDEPIKSRFDSYISDSSIKSDHVWRYGVSPEQAMKDGAESICLLTHPQHWNYHLSRNIRKVLVDTYEYFFRK